MIDRFLGALVSLVLRVLRRVDPDRASDFCGAVARRLGPFFPAHKIGEANLRAAYPDADDAWIAATLRGAWENLGRVAGEYVHLDKLWDYDLEKPDPNGRIVTDDAGLFQQLKEDGKPALCFAAHLANWELPAVAASRHGLPSAVVYRMPNNRAVAAEIGRIREGLMGRLIRSRAEAAFEMAASLQAGEHLGMLVDQRWSRGPLVRFFGRETPSNPTLARLARQVDCPVVGVRAIRLPGNRFRLSAVGPIALPRTPSGEIDVPAATQAINTIVEGWIREHPEQWLWFHRRWR